jgi:hypothetical protein
MLAIFHDLLKNDFGEDLFATLDWIIIKMILAALKLIRM